MATAEVGIPERRGPARWFVSSGLVGYVVEHIEGRWRCTCPSFRWRRPGTCKHINAVKQWLEREVTMG